MMGTSPAFMYVHGISVIGIFNSCMVQLNLNLIQVCGYMRASTHFTKVKVYNMACIFFVACGFVVHSRAIKYLWHSIHAPHQQTRHERMFS